MRMSMLGSVKSTKDGWRLVPGGIDPESEAHK